MLIGRDAERRVLEDLLEGARGGASGAMVIRGEAGIGKTALMDQIVESSGATTLRCAGAAPEQDLAFAGLAQLVRPLHEELERLPELQASALRCALGVGGERSADRLLLGLATLDLLSEATGSGPLLCVVDDLQWIDAPSAHALLFVARRIAGEGIVMLFGVRDEPDSWFETPGLPQLTLGPLSETAAREVITSARGGSLSQEARSELLRQAGGNPLALLELPVGHGADVQPTGLDGAFRARLLGLPAESRTLLVLAAASRSGDAGTWGELARLAGLDAEARRSAVDAGLISDVEAVVFRHPLARSAVYGSCSALERREAHRLLALAATDALARASHLAAGAERAGEPLAAELERAAMTATLRGAQASAAALFARSAELSTSPAARVRRRIASARANLDAGNSEAASRLAEEALANGGGDTSEQAALAEIRGALELQRGTPAAAYELLVAGARAVAGEDPGRALELQAQAITPAFVAGWPERAFRDAHQFLSSLPDTGRPYDPFLRLFLGATVEAGAGSSDEARARLAEAVRLGADAEDFRLLIWSAIASTYLGDLHSAHELSARAAALARSAGSFNTLPIALLGSARLDVNARIFDGAEEHARAGIELTQQLGQDNLETCFAAILVRCLAARGETTECRELGASTLNRALAHGIGAAADDVRLGLAELELSLGHGSAARDLIAAVSHPLFQLAATPLLVEASLMSADTDLTSDTEKALETLGQRWQDPRRLAGFARARALLAGPDARAEALFLEALSYQSQQSPFERARTELGYGEFLRRGQRRTEARVQLGSALGTFEGLNTPLWADRARAELEATGITARKRDPSTRDALTPQELRIANLVATGATNRDVAAQLFLSPKTVEYHLRKVFLKLGVTSRVELARQTLAPAIEATS